MCSCEHCKGSFKISLTLVGILEAIRAHFRRRVEIVSGYRCPQLSTSLHGLKKSWHSLGKAADITVDGINPIDVFKFLETIDCVRGLGYYPHKNFIHLDVRDSEKYYWVVDEKENYLELTTTNRKKYGLETTSQPQTQPQ